MARLQAALDARGREVRELAHMLAAWEALRVGKDAQVGAVPSTIYCQDMFQATHLLTCDGKLLSCMCSLSWKAGSMLVLMTCRVLLFMVACKAGCGLHAGGGAAAALPGGRGGRRGAGCCG